MPEDFESNDDFDYADDELNDDFEADTDDSYEDEDFSDEDSGDDDPYAWLKEAGEENVKKTWSQYTQTREEVLREKREAEERMRELEPIMRLRDEIFQDPGLVDVIDNYMNNQRPAEREVFDLKNQVNALTTQMTTDREYEELSGWIRENDLDPVSKQEVLQFAVENRIGSLQAAYKAMNFDKAKEKAVDKFANDIKKSRGAKTPRPKAGDNKQKGVSIKDIATMSDADFEKNYRQIVGQYKG